MRAVAVWVSKIPTMILNGSAEYVSQSLTKNKQRSCTHLGADFEDTCPLQIVSVATLASQLNAKAHCNAVNAIRDAICPE